MFIDTETLISSYYEKIKDKYPDLTLQELTLICRTPFKYLKLQWKLTKLPTIRFMYFGTFVVHSSTKLKFQKVFKGHKHLLRPEKREKFEKILEEINQNK